MRRIPRPSPIPVLLLLAACGPRQPEQTSLTPPPVDSALVGSVDAVAGWAYRRGVEADLDADGGRERLVVAADVTLDAAGRPLWEDGHRWAVYVESPEGRRTLLYSAFVPNGFAEAALLEPDGGRRHVLVRERTPARVRDVEVEYTGPGAAHSTSSAEYRVELWLPGSAALPFPPPPPTAEDAP